MRPNGINCVLRSPQALTALIVLILLTASGPAQAQRSGELPARALPAAAAGEGPAPNDRQRRGNRPHGRARYRPCARTQQRLPPPPTNLTIIYKVVYGEVLQYKHANGVVQKFEQWKSYHNDAFNLVRLTNERLADGNNYEYATKPLASPGFDPVDIPCLYMTGDYDFVLRPAEVENLRKFLAGGGTIVFNAARGRDEFNRAVVREMRRVFPQKAMMRVPLDHPLFNARYRLRSMTMLVHGTQTSRVPELYSIDVGTRAAVILVPSGLGATLSNNDYHPDGTHLLGESARRLGVNIIAYMLGSTEYGRFLAQDFPVYAARTSSGDVFRFASVRYTGSWDLNPALQNTLLAGLKDNTRVEVDFQPRTVTLDDPQAGNFPLLFMTGHYDFQLTDREAAGLARYLERGGLLVRLGRRRTQAVRPRVPPRAEEGRAGRRIDQAAAQPSGLRRLEPAGQDRLHASRPARQPHAG